MTMQPRIDNLPALARAAAVPLLAALSAGLPLQVLAQPAWPSKPVRFIVPFPPGGPSDVVARIVAPRFQERLGQPVVVDNRPGAGTQIGTEIVARSAPDGHTLFLGSIVHAINVALYPKLPYESVKDFTMITVLTATPNLLVVHPALPVKNAKDFIALARKRKGEVTYASSGNGSGPHLGMELLAAMADIEMIHVPYKGAAPATTDLLGGQVQAMLNNFLASASLIRAGRLRPLAVTSLKRSAAMPELPTLAESALPGFEVNGWYGMFAPRGTTPAAATAMQEAVAKAMRRPAVAERLAGDGAVAVTNTPAAFTKYLRADSEKWAKVIKRAKVAPETL